MKELNGKGAVVTGAASGIGLGIARILARAGMRVVMADFDEARLVEAVAGVAYEGGDVHSIAVDVSDRASVRTLAAAASDYIGRVHVLCNNAGVGCVGIPLDEMSESDWDWILGVNLLGVVNGLLAFLPLIEAHGDGGHIVNTASIGGLIVRPGARVGAYSTTKFAVVGLSEALRDDLAPKGIGVSVLCPAAVATDIYQPFRKRPARFGGEFCGREDDASRAMIAAGKHPEEIGRWVERAIRDNILHILPHTASREWVERRHERIRSAYAWAESVEPEIRGEAGRDPKST